MKRYQLCRMGIVAGMGAFIGASVAAGNAIAVVAAAALGLALLYLLKKRVEDERDEVLEDELVHKISGKASRATLQVGLVMAAISGAVLIALREQYPAYESTGFVLAFSACVLLVVYLGMYAYYGRHLE